MLLTLLAGSPGMAQSSNTRVLHSFSPILYDGTSPYGRLTCGTDGVLYGVTWSGGTNSFGTVFRLKPDGGEYKVLRSLSNAPDASVPYSGLVQGNDGALYGTTYWGGATNAGTVFKINTNGTSFEILHSFTNSPDGAYPYGGLTLGRDGAFYGTTYGGGSTNMGTVFRITSDGGSYSVLRSFANSPDGAIPFAGLVQGDDGRLYGTTVQGGMNLLGTVFRLGTNGDDYAVLHGFAGLPDGGAPEGELTRGLDGALYGTTVAGGTNGLGTIFKINPDGSGYANLYCFAALPDGAHPYGGLVQGGDGRLYGTTTWGGNANGGTIYRINTNGSGYSVLYHFGSSDADGVLPYASLTAGPNGILYGTTLEGGTNGFGTIYRFAVPPTLSIALLPQGMPQLTLTGFTNYVCQVQAATNFEHWVAFTNVMLTNGVSQMIDPAFPALPQRFYRAVVQ